MTSRLNDFFLFKLKVLILNHYLKLFYFILFLPLTESNIHRSRNILGLVDIENKTETNTVTVDQSTNHVHKNCNEPAIFEIPSDGFTREQRQQGWVAVHVVIAIYCFWFLATICDEYFVPCIQSICSCKFAWAFMFLILFFHSNNNFDFMHACNLLFQVSI